MAARSKEIDDASRSPTSGLDAATVGGGGRDDAGRVIGRHRPPRAATEVVRERAGRGRPPGSSTFLAERRLI